MDNPMECNTEQPRTHRPTQSSMPNRQDAGCSLHPGMGVKCKLINICLVWRSIEGVVRIEFLAELSHSKPNFNAIPAILSAVLRIPKSNSSKYSSILLSHNEFQERCSLSGPLWSFLALVRSHNVWDLQCITKVTSFVKLLIFCLFMHSRFIWLRIGLCDFSSCHEQVVYWHIGFCSLCTDDSWHAHWALAHIVLDLSIVSLVNLIREYCHVCTLQGVVRHRLSCGHTCNIYSYQCFSQRNLRTPNCTQWRCANSMRSQITRRDASSFWTYISREN